MVNMIVACLFFVPSDSLVQALRELIDEAVPKIVRLEPSHFPALPAAVADWMSEQGYTVPQCDDERRPHNVVSGRFDEDDSIDWAVLCSRSDTSRVVVFWGGSLDSTTIAHVRADRDFLAVNEGEGVVYMRMLMVRTPETIHTCYKVWGGVTPDWVAHDAIADYFGGKASVVLYWRDGMLAELGGDD